MSEVQILIRLGLAVIIGGITGLEREKSNKGAGFRTHILVSLGACMSSITSLQLFLQYNGMANLDPARLSAQVLSGIGFLGAGTILKTPNGVRGLTTAAGIWSTACIGIAIGYGYYLLALVSWILLILVLYILKYIDNVFKKKRTVNITLKIDDNNVVPIILSKLKSMNVNIEKLSIGKDEDKECWNLNIDIFYGDDIDFRDIINEIYIIDSKIVIDCVGT